MKKETFNALHELGTMAADLNLNLMLDEKLTLYSYDKKGSVKSIHRFDRNPDGITELKKHLSKVATKLRKKWSPEFKQFLPTLDSLNMELIFEETVAKVTDSDGNTNFYAYSEGGLHAMADELADALLCQHSSEIEEGNQQAINKGLSQQAKQNDICPNTGKPVGNCQNCTNTSCSNNPQLVTLLWDELDENRRKAFLSKLPREVQEKLQTALNVEVQA